MQPVDALAAEGGDFQFFDGMQQFADRTVACNRTTGLKGRDGKTQKDGEQQDDDDQFE